MILKNYTKLFLLSALISLVALLVVSCEKSGSTGEVLYQTNCGNCHLENGKGLGELMPSLINSPILENDTEALVCMIRNGVIASNPQEAVFEEYTMPPNDALSEIEITNIINYARAQFTTNKESVTITEIKKSLENCN